MPLLHRNVCNRGSPKTSRLIKFAVFLSAFSLAAPAHAATYYVSVNGGSDSNPGTQAAPFKTLAKGSQALAAGDTLYLRQGTYNEPMIDGSGGFVFRNGASGNSMTRYASYPGEQATIIGPPGVFVVYFSKKAQYIELSGLIIDGTNASSYAIRLDGDFNTTHASGIRIMSNEIKNGRMGISGGGDCQIIGNNIHNMRNYGMYVYFNNGLIENNLIHDNDGPGVNLFKQEYPVNGWVIRNNILYGNGKGYTREDTGKSYTAPAILIARGSHQIYNNILYNNHGGITVGYGSTDVLVANNTVYGSDDYGINVSGAYAGSKNARIVNNIVWGNKGSQITDTGTGTTLQNNLTSDPNVANAAGHDFHLLAGSPAIDKGTDQSQIFKNDFAYGARPVGATYDIGAYEFGAPPGTTPSPPIPITTGGSTPPSGGGGVFYAPDGSVCPSGYSSR